MIFFVGGVFFFPVFSFQFLSDDWDLVYHADRYESFVDRFVQNDHQGTAGYSYRPIVGVYLTILRLLFGLNPTGYHVFFVLAHILNAVLVMIVFEKLMRWRECDGVERIMCWIPFIVGLLFLVLPSHVEAVAWVAAGVDAVATMLYLLSVLAFVGSFNAQGSGSRKRRWLFAASWLFFVLGLLTKEIVITLPVFLCVVWFSLRTMSPERFGRTWKWFAGMIASFFVFAALYLAARYNATGAFIGYYGKPTIEINPLQWIRMISDMLASFIAWGPLRLRVANFFYHNVHALMAAFALVVLFVKKYHGTQLRSLFMLLACFAVSTLPTLPLGFNPLSDEGERYGYLPSAFFLMLAVLMVVMFSLRLSPDHRVQSSTFKAQNAGRVFFLFFCFFVFAYFGYGLREKFSRWQQRQDSNYQILNQLYEFNDGRAIILIGLPDSYSGVPGFRNGIEEAYRMYYGEPIEIVRIPVYTVDGGLVNHVSRITHGESVEQDTSPVGYSISDGFDHAIQNQLFLKTRDHSLRLTGDKEYRDECVSVHFFRWHYDVHRADGVTLVLQDYCVEEIRNERAQVLLYNGSRLVRAGPL